MKSNILIIVLMALALAASNFELSLPLTGILGVDGLDYYNLIGDTPKSYPAGGSFDKFTFEQIDADYHGSPSYTASLWANRGTFANADNTLFRISEKDTNLGPGSRSPLVSHNPSDPNTLAFKIIRRTFPSKTTAGNYTIDFNDLNYYPQGVWTFFFFSMNAATSSLAVHVLSYQWDGAAFSPHSYFQSFSHTIYLQKNASMMVGGDGMLSNCNCQIAQTRFYPNFATSDEAFIREVLSYGEPVRIMGLNFGAFQGQHSAQEIYFSDTASTNGSIIGQNGISGSADSFDMTEQPFGELLCTGSTMLSVSIASSSWHSGFLMHFWLKPAESGIIISGQSSSGVDVFTLSYISVSQSLLIQRYVASWISFQSPPMSVTLGSWNEILVGFPQNYGFSKVKTVLIVNKTDNYDLGWADETNPLLPITILTFCAGFPTLASPSSLFSGTIRSWMLYLGYLNFDTKRVMNCSKSVGIHNDSVYCLSCSETNLLLNGSCYFECPKETLYTTEGLQFCFTCNPNIQGDYAGYCAPMNTANCLQYNPSKNSCDVCLPGYVFDNNICSTNCSNSSQVPIYRSGTCNQNQPLIAQIAGDDRLVPYNDTVALDASITQYPNNSSPLYYTWFCTKNTNPSLSCESNNAVKLNVRSTSPLLVIPPNTYPIDASYNFSVKVESEDGNSSVYYVQLTFANNTFSVIIEYPRPLYQFCLSDTHTFWVSDTFSNSRYSVKWSSNFLSSDIYRRDPALPRLTMVTTYPHTILHSLTIPDTINIRVTIKDQNLTGESSVQFTLNRPATGGTINLSPASGGIPLSTPFQISADGWNDLDSGPLVYAFYYHFDYNSTLNSLYPPGDNANFTMLRDFSPVNQISTYLPNKSPIKVFVSIKDATGCYTNVSTIFNFITQIKDTAQALEDLITFSKLIMEGDQGVSASSIRVLTDELKITDKLLDCKYNADLSMSSCLPGPIPDRCQTSFHCSSHGQCSNGRCVCDLGYYLADCSMNGDAFSRQLASRMALINFAASYFPNSSISYERVKAATDLMLRLSERVYLNTNDTYKMILDSLDALIAVADTYSQSDALQMLNTIAEIISNVIHGAVEASCGLTTNYSIHAVQKSISLLSNLSDLYVKNVNNGTTEIILETKMLLAYVLQNVSSSQLSGLLIDIGDNYPQVQIGTVPHARVLPDYLIANYLYLKSDPLKCNDSTSANFTLIFKHASTLQPVDLSASAKISYNNESFYWIQCFAPACSQVTDSSGNPTCECIDISAFDLTTQLSNYHNLSKLYAPKVSVITTDPKDPLSSRWSFWISIAFSLCLLLGHVIIGLGKTNFCILTKIKKANEAERTLPRCYKILIVILFLNPVCNLFIYKSTKLGKPLRLFLLYVREMSFLVFSGVFISQTSFKTSLEINLPLTTFVILAIPAYSLLLEKLLSVDEEKAAVRPTRTGNIIENELDDSPRKKSEIGLLINFWAALITVSLAMALLTLAILFSIKYSNVQVSTWQMNYVYAILVDLLVCPTAGLIMTFAILKYLSPEKYRVLEPLLDYNLCLLLRTLKWVPPLAKREVEERGQKAAQDCKSLDQSALALRTMSTIGENKPRILLNMEKRGGMNERSPSLILGGSVLDTQDLGDNIGFEKKRLPLSAEEDEQSKKPALTSKFSGQSSGSSEEERLTKLKRLKHGRTQGLYTKSGMKRKRRLNMNKTIFESTWKNPEM